MTTNEVTWKYHIRKKCLYANTAVGDMYLKHDEKSSKFILTYNDVIASFDTLNTACTEAIKYLYLNEVI